MSCSSSAPATELPTHEIRPIMVNGQTIAESDIAQEVQHHPSDSVEEAVHKASEALIVQSLLKQKAVENGFLVDLASSAEDEEIAISKLLEAQASSPAASDEECQRYYDANRSKFCSSPLVEVSHILLPASPEDVKARMDLKEKAQEIIKQLQASPDSFSALVKQYSACPSKETGGSLGQLSKGQTVPEFERVVFQLDQGVAAHPVESRYGFHIVLVHHRVEGQQLDFDVVKGQVSQYLNERTQRKAISQYLQVLLSEAEIDGFTPQISGSPLIQ